MRSSHLPSTPLLAVCRSSAGAFRFAELTYDALCAIAKSANDDVAEYRRQVEDYREYIETWVHEAKSPLAAAHLMLANLEERAEDGATYERLQSVGDELKRIEGYIDQALFYARSEALDRDYLIRNYTLADLVNASIKSNASALIAAHVAPVRHGLDLTVFTDEKWIEFAFWPDHPEQCEVCQKPPMHALRSPASSSIKVVRTNALSSRLPTTVAV